MALASYAGAASYDQADSHFLDLSDVMSSILMADTFFLGRISKGEAGTQTVHYWMEDSLNAVVIEANGAISDAATTITVNSSAGVRVGALLMDEAIGKSEIMQVVDVTSATQIEVVRGYGDAAIAGETHADGSQLRIVGQPVQEGDTSVADQSVTRLRKSNTYQIFKKEIQVSGTTKAIKSAGVPDEFNYQVAQRMLEIHRELGDSHLNGVLKAAGSDSVYRSMDGVRNVVRIGGNVITTAEALSEPVVNALNTLIWNKGGQADIAVGNDMQMTKFAELYKDKIRLSPSDKQVGRFITKFLTDKGTELDLITDRWARKGDLLLLDSKRLSLHALTGRDMHMEPLAKVGDSDRAMIIGEYTQFVRNAAQAHALHSGLTA